MKRPLRNLLYWFLDYEYITRRQILGTVSTDRPEKYRVHGGMPIVLIPGIYESWQFMRPIAKTLYLHGYDVHVVDSLGHNRGTVEEMAKKIESYIATHYLSNVVIVSHSKGGLIGKYLLSAFTDTDTIRGLVALNAPFSGSLYAHALPFRSLRMFKPNSKIITSLSIDRTSNGRIVSIYGKFDPHIPFGSRLEGAKNVQLDTYGHFRIISDPAVHAAILKNLALFHAHKPPS